MKTILQDGSITSFNFNNKITTNGDYETESLIFRRIQTTFTEAKALPTGKFNMVGDIVTTVNYSIYITIDNIVQHVGILNSVPMDYKLTKKAFKEIIPEEAISKAKLNAFLMS